MYIHGMLRNKHMFFVSEYIVIVNSPQPPPSQKRSRFLRPQYFQIKVLFYSVQAPGFWADLRINKITKKIKIIKERQKIKK